jgi:hypothetical protein
MDVGPCAVCPLLPSVLSCPLQPLALCAVLGSSVHSCGAQGERDAGLHQLSEKCSKLEADLRSTGKPGEALVLFCLLRHAGKAALKLICAPQATRGKPSCCLVWARRIKERVFQLVCAPQASHGDHLSGNIERSVIPVQLCSRWELCA